MKKVSFLLLFTVLLSGFQEVHAFIFERRQIPPPKFAYFVYPVVGTIPGVQTFYGAGFTLGAIADSNADLTFVSLAGETKYFRNNEKFRINLLTVIDVPVFTNHLQVSGVYSDVRNGTIQQTQRGINSDKDKTFYLMAKRAFISGIDVSLSFFDDRLEFYYGVLRAEIDPYGIQVGDDLFLRQDAEVELNPSPEGYRFGIYLDDTDNRRDPRIGYRVQMEYYKVPRASSEAADYYQIDKNFTAYIPFGGLKHVVVLNYFESDSGVLSKGSVDRNAYRCPLEAPPACQQNLDEVFARQQAEAENGRATALGGVNRLRGYPAYRFVDNYTRFYGAEYRWYIHETNVEFERYLQKGVFLGSQLAAFYEVGTVAPTRAELDTNRYRYSYGVGYRAVMGTVVIRLDYGIGDEGGTTTLFIGYPF